MNKQKENNVFLNIFIVIISPIIYFVLAIITLTYMILTSIEYILFVTYFLLKYLLIFIYRVLTIQK
jgi:hypothetical protein